MPRIGGRVGRGGGVRGVGGWGGVLGGFGFDAFSWKCIYERRPTRDHWCVNKCIAECSYVALRQTSSHLHLPVHCITVALGTVRQSPPREGPVATWLRYGHKSKSQKNHPKKSCISANCFFFLIDVFPAGSKIKDIVRYCINRLYCLWVSFMYKIFVLRKSVENQFPYILA